MMTVCLTPFGKFKYNVYVNNSIIFICISVNYYYYYFSAISLLYYYFFFPYVTKDRRRNYVANTSPQLLYYLYSFFLKYPKSPVNYLLSIMLFI